jgi:branched-chain amino acid transport system ATP-binding protein
VSAPSGRGENVDEVEAPRSAPVLEAQAVSVQFGGVSALTGVDLKLHGGEVCGLIGPNGAGKTTLFDVLSGVTFPTTGAVMIDSVDVTRRSAVWRARHGVRRTFQRQQTFGWLSVEDNVLVALEWRARPGRLVRDLLGPIASGRSLERERRDVVNAVLELCGLTDVRHEPAGHLSIGRARMVELARAVVEAPRALLLDEPTSGLEEGEARRLAECVHELRRQTQCAVLLVEHDIPFVMRECDRIWLVHSTDR